MASSTQFAPSRRMGICDPMHQMSMWEDAYRSPISPNTGMCMIPKGEEDRLLHEKSDQYSSEEPLMPPLDSQAARSISDKVMRRLAQNREAARKSRMRKKVYVQQLETSRIRLAQLELELDRARQQGMCIGGAAANVGAINPGIAAFEMEYAQWVEDKRRKTLELRTVLQTPANDIELHIIVDSFLSHYQELFRMKAEAAKADVFYVMSGVWKTSVERFFIWIGGFRPSELVNILIPAIEPLTDQQLVNVCNLRHSCQQAEDALKQGIDKLQQNLVQSIATDPLGMATFASQMASSVEMLEALESFVIQADHLRQQTLQRMSFILTPRQAARGLLAFGEYFQRLRTISSLWAARTRGS